MDGWRKRKEKGTGSSSAHMLLIVAVYLSKFEHLSCAMWHATHLRRYVCFVSEDGVSSGIYGLIMWYYKSAVFKIKGNNLWSEPNIFSGRIACPDIICLFYCAFYRRLLGFFRAFWFCAQKQLVGNPGNYGNISANRTLLCLREANNLSYQLIIITNYLWEMWFILTFILIETCNLKSFFSSSFVYYDKPSSSEIYISI